MKKFLISIDTEGDNLWNWHKGETIYTENAKYLGRFQNICEQYGFKPTYLTNYEMAMSEDYQKFIKPCVKRNTAEIGMHLHAWNTPPEFALSDTADNPGAPYLIEYPDEIMEKKINFMTSLLESIFETEVITHRAGRWATNQVYFSLLAKYGYKVDCSVTPHMDWTKNSGETKGSGGTNYTDFVDYPYIISTDNGDVFEIPVTVRKSHGLFTPPRKAIKSSLGSLARAIGGQYLWLRPNGYNLEEMLWLIDQVAKDGKTDYIMFMLHSSEFMPGGSPTFKTGESIEHLYSDINTVFKSASKYFEGSTIGDYGRNAFNI